MQPPKIIRLPTSMLELSSELCRNSCADISSTPANPTTKEAQRSGVRRSPSISDASSALITGMSRFRMAPLEARDLVMPQVMPSWASTCPPTPAIRKAAQSRARGRAAAGFLRRILTRRGISSSVVTQNGTNVMATGPIRGSRNLTAVPWAAHIRLASASKPKYQSRRLETIVAEAVAMVAFRE